MEDMISFAGFGVGIFAFICEIISISLEYWIYVDANNVERYAGLWKSCIESSVLKGCSTDGATDALRAVQAMLLLGLLTTVAAVVCGALKLFVMKDKKMLTFAATGLLAASGLFLMIGFAVYNAEIYDPLKSVYDLHAGFAFCVIAWLATWIAAALFGLVAMKEK